MPQMVNRLVKITAIHPARWLQGAYSECDSTRLLGDGGSGAEGGSISLAKRVIDTFFASLRLNLELGTQIWVV